MGDGFPGTWMTESESVVYRVVPKCACSTIGQIMYYSDNGNISTATSTMPRAGCTNGRKSQPAEATGEHHVRTSVLCLHLRAQSLHPHPVELFRQDLRHSAQRRRYRGNLVPLLIQKYGIEVGGDDGKGEFDQIKASAGSCCLPATPSLAPPDGPRHPLVGHVGPCLDLHREWRALRHIFWTRGLQ
jgi:hypothetical protein